MAITLADFTNIWASTSPLTPYSFSTSNYEEGWNFIGSTPPARQMWDSIQKQNDEKMKYIVDNFLPTAGGTMTGTIKYNGTNNRDFRFEMNNSSANFDIGWNFNNVDGALLGLRSADFNGGGTNAGAFVLGARKGVESSQLIGEPNGELYWKGVLLTDGSFITIKKVSINVTSSSNPIGTITAPTVSGYQFVIWVQCVSNGNVFSVFPNNPLSTTPTLYGSGMTAGTSADCYALYVRKW